jgi:hypothetical protein
MHMSGPIFSWFVQGVGGLSHPGEYTSRCTSICPIGALPQAGLGPSYISYMWPSPPRRGVGGDLAPSSLATVAVPAVVATPALSSAAATTCLARSGISRPGASGAFVASDGQVRTGACR